MHESDAMLMVLLEVYIVLGAISAAALMAAATRSGLVDVGRKCRQDRETPGERPGFRAEGSQPFVAMMTPRMATHDMKCKEVRAACLGNAEAMYQEMRVWKEKQPVVFVGTVDSTAI